MHGVRLFVSGILQCEHGTDNKFARCYVLSLVKYVNVSLSRVVKDQGQFWSMLLGDALFYLYFVKTAFQKLLAFQSGVEKIYRAWTDEPVERSNTSMCKNWWRYLKHSKDIKYDKIDIVELLFCLIS